MFQIIGAIFKLLILFFSAKAEKDKERKEKKDALRKELGSAIKNSDTSHITAVIDRINRMR